MSEENFIIRNNRTVRI